MKVLSLFDGISCGMVALERAGIPVEQYYAYEIEPSAIKISKKNYPNIIQCGDVFDTDFCQFVQNIDLLIGGSPCTFWSKARGKNREIDTSGMGYKLFSKFAEALHNVQPKYFLYENNYGIDKTIVNSISEQLGVKPVMINSELVSAQRRKRYYWTNIPNVTQPKDKGLLIKDIYIPDDSLVREDVRIQKTACKTKNYIKYDISEKGYFLQQNRSYYLDGKAPTLPSGHMENKVNILIDPTNWNKYKIISLVEAERLQTLPDNYTEVEGVRKSQSFAAIGNGWTVDVIAHIFKNLHKKKTAENCHSQNGLKNNNLI